MSKNRGRSGSRWRRLVRQIRSEQRPLCCRCHQPIDYSIPYRDPDSGNVNPWCFSVDHYPHPLSTHPHLAEDYSNLDAAHLTCNQSHGDGRSRHKQKRTAQAKRRPLVPLHLVTGPPCSGKTTHVRQHAGPTDVVIDWDAIAQALGSPSTHDHPPHLVPFVAEARDAVIARLARPSDAAAAWLIKTNPTADEYAAAASVVTLDPGVDECLARAHRDGRPQHTLDGIRTWYLAAATRPTAPTTTTELGQPSEVW